LPMDSYQKNFIGKQSLEPPRFYGAAHFLDFLDA